MVAYVSTGAGNWSAAATWGGGGTPGIGDTATVRHDVMLDAAAFVAGTLTVGTGAGVAIVIDENAGVGPGYLYLDPAIAAGTYTLHLDGAINIIDNGVCEFGSSVNRVPSNVIFNVIFSTADRYISVGVDGVGTKNLGGTLNVYGAQNYHCAGEAYQRTQLFANILAGAGVAFRTTEAVDWQIGDTIWIGCNGNKAAAATNTAEKIVIAGKVDASNYTANFANAHSANDFLVNEERNVIISGNSATEGFSIFCSFNGTHNCHIKIDWAAIWWPGRAGGYNYDQQGIGIQHTLTTETAMVPAGYIGVTNTVFQSLENGTNFCFYFDMFTRLADANTTAFKNLHLYSAHGWQPGFHALLFNTPLAAGSAPMNPGEWRFDNVTHITSNTSSYMLMVRSSWNSARINLDGLWWCGATGRGYLIFSNMKPLKSLINAKLYGFYSLCVQSAGTSYPNLSMHGDTLYEHCEIYNMTETSWLFDDNDATHKYIFRDIEFYRFAKSVYWITNWGGDILFEDCSFDECNYGPTATEAALKICTPGTNQKRGSLRFYNCTFGMTSRNQYGNLIIDDDADGYLAGDLCLRIVFEKCSFKEQLNSAWAGAASSSWTDTMGWVYRDVVRKLNDWRVRARWGSSLSLELIDCVVQNAAGADQWPITYPNVTRLGVVAGGSEIRKEITTVIDNTFALKILPYSPVERAHVTRPVPVLIPADAGQTVTVKLSLRKDQSQAAGRRPMIHLYGLGIDDAAEMTDAVGTWEELTVSGTTTIDGVVRFWVSAMNEHDGTIAFNPDSYNSPHVLGWLNVYADGIDITVA